MTVEEGVGIDGGGRVKITVGVAIGDVGVAIGESLISGTGVATGETISSTITIVGVLKAIRKGVAIGVAVAWRHATTPIITNIMMGKYLTILSCNSQ